MSFSVNNSVNIQVTNNPVEHNKSIQTAKMKKYRIKGSSPELTDNTNKHEPKSIFSCVDRWNASIDNDYKEGRTLKGKVKEFAFIAANALMIATSIALVVLKSQSTHNDDPSCIDVCNNGSGLFDCSCLMKY